MRTSILFASLLCLAACGPMTAKVDAGAETDAGSIVTSDAGTESDAGSSIDAGTPVSVIEVVSGADSHRVDLATLPTAQLGDKSVVKLDVVVKAAFPTIDLATIHLGFLAYDGFDPGSKANCVGLVPVAGTLLVKGGITADTANVQWEDSLGYPGCLYVHGVVKLTVTSP